MSERLHPGYKPFCQNCAVVLGIIHENCTPAQLSNLMAIPIARCCSFGTDKPMFAGKVLWELSSDSHVASVDLRDRLKWLLELLEGKKEVLESLRREGAQMTIGCDLVGYIPVCMMEIPADQLAALGQLGIGLQIVFRDRKTAGMGLSEQLKALEIEKQRSSDDLENNG